MTATPLPAGLAPRERTLAPERLGGHMDRLHRAALALCGSRDEAEDLVQETYLRVLRRPRYLRHEDDLGYLLRTLRNTFCDHLRSRDRRPPTIPATAEIERLEDGGAADPAAALHASELLDAVRGLPEPFRETLVAVDILGLSYAQAARALRTREGTIMSRLYRGRRRLAHALQLGP